MYYRMRQKLVSIGSKIAEISKRWFRVRDTYGVEVAPDQNQALVLAVAVAVDAMTHPAK